MGSKNKSNKQADAYRPVTKEDFTSPGVYAELQALGFQAYLDDWKIKNNPLPTINENHVKLVTFLVEKQVSIPQIVNEINQLNAIEAEILHALYNDGLRGEHLRQCTKPGNEDRLCISEGKIWAHFLRNKQLTASQVVEELKDLSLLQMRTLIELYDTGLRGEHLRSWQAPANSSGNFFRINFSALHSNKLKELLTSDHPLSPEDAIKVISHVPDKILQDPKLFQQRIANVIQEEQSAPSLMKR